MLAQCLTLSRFSESEKRPVKAFTIRHVSPVLGSAASGVTLLAIAVHQVDPGALRN